MYTLSHDPSSDTQPSFEVTIETKRHRSAEVDTVITSARCGADVTGAPSRATYRPSKSCSSASQPPESNYVTSTPGNCVTYSSMMTSLDISSIISSSLDISSSLPSFVRIDLRFRHEHDRCVREPIKRTFTRACARACMYRARRGDVARENAPKFVAKSGRKTVSGGRDGVHSIIQFFR